MNDSYPIATKWFWWLLGLTTLLLFFRLGSAPIYILDEAKNAECAREMLMRHDWITPTFNGELRTDKPVLHYWFMMIAYKMFGVNEFAARFFSVLMGLGTIAITYFFTARWVNSGVAFFAALVLALSGQFLFEFRLSVPDPYLIFFTTAGLFCGFSYVQTKKWKWIILTAIFLALASLAKGPVALALPGLAILVFIISSKRWLELLDYKFLVAALVYFVIAAPWYLAVHKATGGAFTQGFFFEHNLHRFSSEMEGHGGPFIIVPLIVFIGLLPVCAFIFSIFKTQTGVWQKPFTKFSFFVMLIYVVFFSISSTKLPNYPMPCYAFVAILIGNWINRVLYDRKKLPLYGFIIMLVVALAVPVGGYFALRAEVATRAIAVHALWVSFLPLVLVWIIINRNRWRAPKTITTLAIAYFVFNLVFVGMLYPMIYRLNPVTQTQTTITNPKYAIVAYQDFNAGFLFNLQDSHLPVPIYHNSDSLKVAVEKNLQQNLSTFIITTQSELSTVDTGFYRIVEQRHDLFENPTTIILEKK